MRVKLSGTDVVAWGDDVSAPFVEFTANYPVGVPNPLGMGWTVTGSAGSRVLHDPTGGAYAEEMRSETAPGSTGPNAGPPFNVPVDMNRGASVTGLNRTSEVFRAYAASLAATLHVDFDSGASADFNALVAGSDGDSITITLVNPGPNQAEAVASADGNDVTVVLATDSEGNITSVVSDVSVAIAADADSGALIGLSWGDDDIVDALDQTPLAGGEGPLFAWWVAPNGQEAFAATDEPTDLSVAAGQRFHYYDATSGAPALRYKQADVDGTITKGKSVGITDDGVIKLANLPTSDPAVADQLWNDAGVLKVSAG